MNFMKKNIKNILIAVVVLLTISGCGVTIATVAGIGAYEMYKSPPNSIQLSKDLNHQLPHDYFSIAMLNQSIILAGQVESAGDIDYAKIFIYKKLPDYTIYSYLEVGIIESAAVQARDATTNSKISQLLAANFKKGISSAVANGKVYFLVDSVPNNEELTKLSREILQFDNVRSVITVQERK